MRVDRFAVSPIIAPALHESIGANINGPSLLRDPAIYEEGGRVYLLYSVAGEGGIATAELLFD